MVSQPCGGSLEPEEIFDQPFMYIFQNEMILPFKFQKITFKCHFEVLKGTVF